MSPAVGFSHTDKTKSRTRSWLEIPLLMQQNTPALPYISLMDAAARIEAVGAGLPTEAGAPSNSLGSRTERTLVALAQRGDGEAAAELVRRYWPAAHHSAFLILRDRQLAEDVAQESLLTVIQQIGDFNRRRPLRPWIHRIVVNRSLDFLRSRSAADERERRVNRESPPSVDHRIEDPEMVRALWSLSVEERAAVVLRHVFSFSAEEIADMSGDPPATIRSRLHRGLARLRAALSEELET